MLKEKENIDDYIKDLVYRILILKTELDTITEWHNKWMDFINKEKEKNEKISNKFIILNNQINKYIYEPKKYEYSVYARAFLDTLKIYLKSDHRSHIRNKDMWESSKYLKCLVNIIFKTGFYKDINDNEEWEKKIFNDESKIIIELEELTSFISEPLHGFQIYFNIKSQIKNNKNFKEYMNEKISNIVSILKNNSIFNDNIIKHALNPNIDENELNYLKWTTSIEIDNSNIKNFLKFIQDSCLDYLKKLK